MKKALLIFASVAAGVLMIAAPHGTNAAQPKTTITGTVTNNGAPVKKAKVAVVCNNAGRNTTTNAAGEYTVQFKASECQAGSKVTVVATKKGLGGVSTGQISNISSVFNVAVINVSVPEFGVATGFAATGAAVGLFFVMRRRQLQVETARL